MTCEFCGTPITTIVVGWDTILARHMLLCVSCVMHIDRGGRRFLENQYTGEATECVHCVACKAYVHVPDLRLCSTYDDCANRDRSGNPTRPGCNHQRILMNYWHDTAE